MSHETAWDQPKHDAVADRIAADIETWAVSGEKPGTPPVVGQRYKVIHSRKGEFWGTVIDVREIWATVRIDRGVARAVMSYNVAYKGDEVTIRSSHSLFVPCDALAAERSRP